MSDNSSVAAPNHGMRPDSALSPTHIWERFAASTIGGRAADWPRNRPNELGSALSYFQELAKATDNDEKERAVLTTSDEDREGRLWELRAKEDTTPEEGREMRELRTDLEALYRSKIDSDIEYSELEVARIIESYNDLPHEHRTPGCRTWYVDRVIDYLNKFFFVVVGDQVSYGQTSYKDSSSDDEQRRMPSWQASGYAFRSQQDAKQVMLLRSFWSTTTSDKKDKKDTSMPKLFELWVTHPRRRKYKRKVLNPGDPDFDDEDAINTFVGFDIDRDAAAAKYPNVEEAAGAIKPFRDHILNVWCRGNPTSAEYVYNWFAHLIQRPWKKMGSAIVLRGPEGAGKGVPFQLVGKILGPASFKQPTSIEDCLGTFAAYVLEGAILLFLDEAVWGGDKKSAGTLKKMITEDQFFGQKKYKDVQMTQSFVNVGMASNEEWVVPAGRCSRRWFVLDVDEKYAGPSNPATRDYFSRLLAVDPAALARWLYERDIRNWDPRDVVVTDALREQQTKDLKPTEAWWHTQLCRPDGLVVDHEPKESVKSAVYDLAIQGMKHRVDPGLFWKTMKAMSSYTEVSNHKKGRGSKVTFLGLDEQRRKWREYRRDANWEFDGEGEVVPPAQGKAE